MKLFFSIFFACLFFVISSAYHVSYAADCSSESLRYAGACNRTSGCFWYSGWSINMEPEHCVEAYPSSNTVKGEICNDTGDSYTSSYCYSDMSCFPEKHKCYKSYPAGGTTTPTPTRSRGNCEVPGSNRWSCMQQTECNSNGGKRYDGNNNICTAGICCDLGSQVATPTTTSTAPHPDAKNIKVLSQKYVGVVNDVQIGQITIQNVSQQSISVSVRLSGKFDDGHIDFGVQGIDTLTPGETRTFHPGCNCRIWRDATGHVITHVQIYILDGNLNGGNPLYTSEWISISTKTPTDPNRNSCELDDNADSAFKCMSTCAAPYATSTNNAGYYSCGSKGGNCCKNLEIYKNRKLQGGGPGVNPSPGGGTTPGAEGGPSPSSGICAGKGGPDTNFSKPDGFWGSTCDGKFIQDTDPKTAKPGRQYADRYKCANPGTVDDRQSSSKACDSYPWIDNSPAEPICTAGKGGAKVDCSKAYGPGYVCTYDYNSSGINGDTRCTPYGTRYCPVSRGPVGPAQGCPGLQSGIGQTCGVDKQCEDYAAGARCDLKSKTCQWPDGTPPTPTAGPAGNCGTPGFKGTGCECLSSPTSCGCRTTHNPEASWDNPSKYFCVPFPATQKWCTASQTLTSTLAACTGATPYASPTPAVSTAFCPSDGNHLCALPRQCVIGYKESTNPAANAACDDWDGGETNSSVCLVRSYGATCPGSSPAPTTVVSSTPAVPTVNPAIGHCPVDNLDGRVNACSASCTGSYPNAKPDGNADCQAAYGTARGLCCTSN